ncbi:MAG: TauD/TfdA family dioxygenase [Candidatus Tectomicrobia bacterium]|nr:TauD/TfdA family dioxygenase [Candidatus Tectomicrobia bacterium]
MMTRSIDRIGGTFVAEVRGIDLAHDLDDAATWKLIHQAYLNHKVLIFRNQDLTSEQFCTFGERFGEIEPHTIRKFWHPDHPGITILSNRTEYGRPKGIRDAGSYWHSDYSYRKRPANVTMLYALEVPEEGGDTLVADLAAAYDALTPQMQERLAGLCYRGQYRWHKDRNHPESMWQLLTPEERAQNPEVDHPVVRTHPETGQRSIFVFPSYGAGIKGIVGWAEAESEALLQTLYDHVTDARFQYRFKWPGPGTVLLWDNRCTMHAATTNVLPPDHFRTLYRISTIGDIPC